MNYHFIGIFQLADDTIKSEKTLTLFWPIFSCIGKSESYTVIRKPLYKKQPLNLHRLRFTILVVFLGLCDLCTGLHMFYCRVT